MSWIDNFCSWGGCKVEENNTPFFFPPAEEEVESNKQEEQEQEEQEQEEQEQEEQKETIKNEELEDKPVFEPTSKESEDSHGGDESTDSIEDSPNPGDESSESEKDQEEQEKIEDSNENQESSENKNGNSLFGSDCSAESKMSRRFKEKFVVFADSINAKTISEEVGGDVLNPHELMRRKITKQSLSSCFVYENKPKVALVLDSSGSMDALIPELEELGKYFEKVHGNKVIDAPNFCIDEEKYNTIQNSDVVIFIGDYDGSDTVLKIAETGKMFYWLCTESRYENVSDHNWCGYDEKHASKVFRMETFKVTNCNEIGEPEYNEKLWLRAIDKLMQ